MADDAELMRFKGRKRLRYDKDWKRKILKDSGEVYETYKGETKAAKTSPNITCHCSLNVLPR